MPYPFFCNFCGPLKEECSHLKPYPFFCNFCGPLKEECGHLISFEGRGTHGKSLSEKGREEETKTETQKVVSFKTERGPGGAQELLLRFAKDETLNGVIILSLHGEGEDERVSYGSSNLSFMEKTYLQTFLQARLAKEMYE